MKLIKPKCPMTVKEYNTTKDATGHSSYPHPRGTCSRCGSANCSDCPWAAYYKALNNNLDQPVYDYSVYGA